MPPDGGPGLATREAEHLEHGDFPAAPTGGAGDRIARRPDREDDDEPGEQARQQAGQREVALGVDAPSDVALDALQADPAATNEWAAANCGWTKIAVTAEDFHFTGVPDTLEAGDDEFDMTNTGKEFHVLVIVKRKDGVIDSFEQLLSDPSGEAKVETLLGVAAPPGVPASSSVRLEPGEYLVLCPIPIGTSGDTQGSGPPHFTAGMQQALTVT